MTAGEAASDEVEKWEISQPISELNVLKRGCRLEMSAADMPRYRYTFNLCKQFENQLKIHISDIPDLARRVDERLADIDKEYGNSLRPKKRHWNLLPEEMDERFEILSQALHDSGFDKLKQKGEGKRPEIHVYAERNWQKWLIPMLQDRIKNEQHSVAAFFGEVGSGKSVSAIQYAYGLHFDSMRQFGLTQPFGLENVAFDQDEFFTIETYDGPTKGRGVVEDDSSIIADPRQWGQEGNVAVAQVFDTFRFKGEHHVLTSPRDKRIDSAVKPYIQLVFIASNKAFKTKNQQGLFEVGIPEWDDDGSLKGVSYLRFEEPGTFFHDCDPFTWILDSVQFQDPRTIEGELKEILDAYAAKKARKHNEISIKRTESIEIAKMKKQLREKEVVEKYEKMFRGARGQGYTRKVRCNGCGHEFTSKTATPQCSKCGSRDILELPDPDNNNNEPSNSSSSAGANDPGNTHSTEGGSSDNN